MFRTNSFRQTADLFVTNKKVSIIERYNVTSFQSILNRPILKKDVFELIHSAGYVYYRKFIMLKRWRTKSFSVYVCKTEHCPFHVRTQSDPHDGKCILIVPGNLSHSPQCIASGKENIQKKGQHFFKIRLANHPLFFN